MEDQPAATSLFNPQASIRVDHFAGGRSCVVVDDAMLDPGRLLQFAAQFRDRFRAVDFSKYPGTYLDTPGDLDTALVDQVLQHARRHFDVRRCLDAHVRLSLVTLPPQALRPRQWFCHVDDALVPAGQRMIASVLYLFRDEGLGGTAFYEPARPQAEIESLWQAADAMSPADFTRHAGVAPGYQDDSNGWFTRIGHVPARFNRLIIYDGGMLHSAAIPAGAALSEDPLAGRLTLNGFLTCRRNLA